jgi:pimeloyl-ACP methyl ester carboxylesterase
VLLSGMLCDETLWDGFAELASDDVLPWPIRIDLDDSVPEMAASLLAAAPPRFAVAGHSLGAIVALEVVRQAPQRVTGLALVNASGRGPSDAQQASWAATLARLDQGEFAQVATELSRLTLPNGQREDADLVSTNQRMADHVGETGLRRQLRAQQARTSYLDALGSIAVPVLVVSGALDEICPPARQEEIVAHCPPARLVELADTGHMAPLERPQALAAHLRQWLGGS